MKTLPVNLTKHAREQILLRNISEEQIKEIMIHPDSVVMDEFGVSVFQKIVTEKNKQYLYRVFVNTEKQPYFVVTAYKTSKIGKYENKIR
jgi:hypothetical protein